MHHLVGHPAFTHHPVGGFDEAVVIDLGEGGQGDDQADVRAFRSFNGQMRP